MNRVRAFLLLSLILLQGCGPGLTFNAPQPLKGAALQHFPQKLIGSYIAPDRESMITITDSMMIRAYDYEEAVPKDSSTRAWHLAGDTLFSGTGYDSVEATSVKAIGDTFLIHVTYVDTLFLISDDGVLKKYKGYYLLNERYKTDSENKYEWGVTKISLTKGLLTISQIGSPADLNKLKEITETTADTTIRNFKVNQDQFNNFMKTAENEDVEQFMLIRH